MTPKKLRESIERYQEVKRLNSFTAAVNRIADEIGRAGFGAGSKPKTKSTEQSPATLRG